MSNKIKVQILGIEIEKIFNHEGNKLIRTSWCSNFSSQVRQYCETKNVKNGKNSYYRT